MSCFKQIGVFVFALQFLCSYAGISGCPTNWKGFDDSCYFQVRAAVTWPAANYNCKAIGGRLARIKSNRDNSYLLNEFLKNGKFPNWFGLRRCGGSKWCFPDWNIAGSFYNWNTGEPNDFGGYEGCGEIRSDGYWNDNICENKFHYICQRSRVSTPTVIDPQILVNEHGKILESLNNITENLKMLLNMEHNKLGSYERPGKSCLDILTRTAGTRLLNSGEYWIRIDSNGPLKVFCDMKTDGGGWTLVTNIILSDSNGYNWSPATDYRQISDYNNNKLGIYTSALGKLKSNMPFTQLRFYCQKKIPGRTIDIVTKNNVLGQHVSQYFTGKTNYFPKACGSFARLPADNSIMAQECSKWGYESAKYNVGKWSHDGIPLNERLYNHAFFVGYKVHWIVPFSKGGRWECDDSTTDKGFVRSTGDFWKIYAR